MNSSKTTTTTTTFRLNTASNDSEEAPDIGLASSSFDGSMKLSDDKNNGQSSQNNDLCNPRAPVLESGHHDPKQRTIYLLLLALSCLSALAGFSLILVWMFKYRVVTGLGLENAGQLANLHPVMMFMFMVSLNMYAVLIYRTHYSHPKEQLKWAHAILSGLNIVMSLLGVFAMYKSHLMAGIPNFYSIHSWIGVLTNSLYLSQFIFGFVAFMKPGLALHRRAALMPWHRIAGAMILVLACMAAVTGIGELVIFQDKDGVYSKFTAITFVANLAGISVIVMTGVSIYLLTAPNYLRPRLPEEVPLKR